MQICNSTYQYASNWKFELTEDLNFFQLNNVDLHILWKYGVFLVH